MRGDYTFGWKRSYEEQKQRADRLEVELKLLKITVHEDTMDKISEANRALKIATETIVTLRSAKRLRGNDED